MALFKEAFRRLIINENLVGWLEESSFGIVRSICTQNDIGGLYNAVHVGTSSTNSFPSTNKRANVR
jgi:hypothetical protein